MKLKLLAHNTSPYPTPPPLPPDVNIWKIFILFYFFFGCQDFFWISRGSPYADIGDAR